MANFDLEAGRYRVLLLGVGNNTEEEKESFSQNFSHNFNIPSTLLKKIVDRSPFIIKRNLSLEKAEILARTLMAFGAKVSIEERKIYHAISLEFQELVPFQLALESSYLRKARRGTWNLIGRTINISDETLYDTWVLVQIFGDHEEFIAFEESPFPINPLPPGEASPFKVVFEGDFSVKRISIAFKNAAGQPLPAVDKRKKREWVGVDLDEESVHFIPVSSPPVHTEQEYPASDQIPLSVEPVLFSTESETIMDVSVENPPEPIVQTEEKAEEALTLNIEETFFPSEDKLLKKESETLTAVSIQKDELKTSSTEENISEEVSVASETIEGVVSKIKEDQAELVPETIENHIAVVSKIKEDQTELTPETIENQIDKPVPEDKIEIKTAVLKAVLGDFGSFDDHEEEPEKPHLDPAPFLEKATKLLDEISKPYGESRKENHINKKNRSVQEESVQYGREVEGGSPERPLFLWMENFRDSVEAYYKKPQDVFSIWFEECKKGGEFKDSLHAILTILVHSRFDQGNQPVKALVNTQKVFRLMAQSGLLLDEIPMLEETPFVSGKVWRDLFYRAFLKTRKIGEAILETNKWSAFDLQRLIQVIPHMGHHNSRIAIWWINELTPDIVEIDFSKTPIEVGESLYRVASRLGIVDPHFDYYQGRGSIGDIKIQTFAKAAFRFNPLKIEEPMSFMGRREDLGGHCFPGQPKCEGCLFETFCPRLYVHLNPSEIGMRE